MKCLFCGHESTDAIEKCAGCPLRSNCRVICCPNCGYELERESTLAKWAEKLLKKQGEKSHARQRREH